MLTSIDLFQSPDCPPTAIIIRNDTLRVHLGVTPASVACLQRLVAGWVRKGATFRPFLNDAVGWSVWGYDEEMTTRGINKGG